MENCTAHPWTLQTGCCYYSVLKVSIPSSISYLTISPSVPNGSAIHFHPQLQARVYLKGTSHTAWPSTEQAHIESHSNTQQPSVFDTSLVSQLPLQRSSTLTLQKCSHMNLNKRTVTSKVQVEILRIRNSTYWR